MVVRPPQAIRELRKGVDLPRQVSGYSEIDTVPGQVFCGQGKWRTGFGGVRQHESRVCAQFGRLADGRATVGFEFDERQGKFHPGVL